MDLRPLLSTLSDGQFHSGEKLGQRLSISRSAVWKQIERLRKMGVEVHSVTGKGYRLPAGLALMSRQTIFEYLDATTIEWMRDLELLFSTTSTNAEAMLRAQAGVERCVIMAEHQTQGRGRRGRSWASPLGANIYLSMVASFQAGVAALEGLSLAVAVYVVRALEKYGIVGLGVKWPNDILIDGRKLAGILLEVSGDLTGPCKIVIGIGLNVRMPAAMSLLIEQPYTDLALNFRGHLDRDKIVAGIIRELALGLVEFNNSGFISLRSSWDKLDVYKGRMVEIRAGSNLIQGRVKGVSETGALLLETDSGPRTVAGGEIMPSMRPWPGN